MKFYLIFFFFSLSSFALNAINLATVDFEYVLENSDNYNEFIIKIDTITLNYLSLFEEEEKLLLEKQININSMRNIINEVELVKIYADFDNKVNNYKSKVDKFNSEILKNIEINKNFYFNEIVKILTQMSIDNDYDLILNKDNFIISRKEYDISKYVIDLLNNMNLNYTLFDFEALNLDFEALN